jgi:hypothetical protein
MNQTLPDTDASDRLIDKNDHNPNQTNPNHQNQVVPIGEVIPDLTYSSLFVMMRLLMGQTGVAKVETAYSSWKILIHSGGVAFIEDQQEFFPTLIRKLKAQKIQVPTKLAQAISLKTLKSIERYRLLSEIYAIDRENCLLAFKEILFENLLAISLDSESW